MTDKQTIELMFRVSKRFQCRMIAELPQPRGIRCEWSPSLPRRLRQSELEAYRRARDAFVAELAHHLGGPALVAEPGPASTRVTVAAPQPCEGRA